MKHHVTSLYIYPVKSLGGISVTRASLCHTGFQYDRRWMLVNAQGIFITQRDRKQLCLFSLSMTDSGFTITYEQQQLSIPLTLSSGEQVEVQVWDDRVTALKAPDTINQWFSNILNEKVFLVYMPDSTYRSINPRHVIEQEQVGFADGYPVLMIGEASLELLQSKIAEPIPMDRFRPNVVIRTAEAHEEDYWQYFSINNLTFRGIKPCKRCVVTTINQQTATQHAEPLKTLATYRKVDNHILFGQNVAAPRTGTISVGDSIDVIDYLPLPLPV